MNESSLCREERWRSYATTGETRTLRRERMISAASNLKKELPISSIHSRRYIKVLASKNSSSQALKKEEEDDNATTLTSTTTSSTDANTTSDPSLFSSPRNPTRYPLEAEFMENRLVKSPVSERVAPENDNDVLGQTAEHNLPVVVRRWRDESDDEDDDENDPGKLHSRHGDSFDSSSFGRLFLITIEEQEREEKEKDAHEEVEVAEEQDANEEVEEEEEGTEEDEEEGTEEDEEEGTEEDEDDGYDNAFVEKYQVHTRRTAIPTTIIAKSDGDQKLRYVPTMSLWGVMMMDDVTDQSYPLSVVDCCTLSTERSPMHGLNAHIQ